MQMKREVECGCNLTNCNVTFTIQVSSTGYEYDGGKPAVLMAVRDNNTRDLVSVLLDARAIDAINNMWNDAVAWMSDVRVAEPHAGK